MLKWIRTQVQYILYNIYSMMSIPANSAILHIQCVYYISIAIFLIYMCQCVYIYIYAACNNCNIIVSLQNDWLGFLYIRVYGYSFTVCAVG